MLFETYYIWLLITVFSGLLWYRSVVKRDDWRSGLLVAGAGVAGVYACVSLFLAIASSVFWDWNAARVLPSFLLVDGLEVYGYPGKAPMLPSMYTPGSYIATTLVTFFRDPNTAVIAAALINVILYMAPAWMLLKPRKGQGVTLVGVLPLLLFVVISLASAALSYSATRVHTDALTLFWSGCGAILLLNPDARNMGPRAAFAGVCLALACWSKQLGFGSALALAIWIAVVLRSPRLFILYSLGGVLTSALCALFVYWRFDFRSFLVNCFVMPSRQPYIDVPGGAWFGAAQELLYSSLSVIVVTTAAVFILSRHRQGDENSESRMTRPQVYQVSLFFFLGTVNIPFSILGRIKEGGDFNQLSFALHFMLLAACLLTRTVLQDPIDHRSRRLLQGVVVAVLLITSLFRVPTIFERSRFLPHVSDSYQIQAFDYEKRHPGEVYFPWHPLSVYLASGRMWHFEVTLYDFKIADLTLKRESVLEYIPPQAKTICYPPKAQTYYIKNWFGLKKPVSIGELPAWECYSLEQIRG